MSLSDDLMGAADMAATLARDSDPANRAFALDLLAVIMRDMAERARMLEGATVPPHWRRQPWDGEARDNVTPLRRGDA